MDSDVSSEEQQQSDFEPTKVPTDNSLREMLKTPNTETDTLNNTEQNTAQHVDTPEINLTSEEIKNILQKHVLNKQKVREYKRNYSQRKRQEQKEYIAKLESNQIKGSSIQMVLYNNKITNHTLNSEEDYIDFINNILGTLQDNKIVLEYAVRNSLESLATIQRS